MFKDRRDAGKKLAMALSEYAGRKNTLVLGLARGGVVVAHEIAKALKLPLDVLLPRKLGAPGMAELAIGAIAEDGAVWLNEPLIKSLEVRRDFIAQEIEIERKVIENRNALYRKGKPPIDFAGKTVILVDDGVATGAMMFVEIQRLKKSAQIIVAVPVSASDAWETLAKLAAKVVCLHVSSDFGGLSEFYTDFAQVSDEEVISSLK
jgi:putative phosphoribosyl transferase